MADPNAHQSLPHASPTFSVSSGPQDRRDGPRNYVFVDEKNRHRRLKVVRACEGCRKRKIRCDAANTNTWPCSACVRIKINCVPPSLSFDHDDSFEYENDTTQRLAFPADSKADSSEARGFPGPILGERAFPGSERATPDAQTDTTGNHYGQSTGAFANLRFETGPDDPFTSLANRYGPSSSTVSSNSTPLPVDADWSSETSESEITEALGDLKISDVAVAPYMINQKGLADLPAVQEEEVSFPGQGHAGLTVRIPDEMMPSEQRCLQYFRYFFDNIHPYVPVIYPPYFYRQWYQAKGSISPLILEGIFACSTHMMEQSIESNQWLALASKHEESFRDVPRLSTLQGLLLLLKAREAVPKRGYYYRSWMTVVNMVAMAKDLGLDSHYDIHRAGRTCGSPDQECIVKTRVWHTLYVVELMIGGPQGRTDYNVRSETVDFDRLPASPSLDDQEQQVESQFTQFMRVIQNIRETSRIYVNLRNKKTDWALDPDFVQHNSAFDSWLRGLPQHFVISFPAGDVAPWISSHFAANVHCYHRLSIIMHHRPQLQQSNSGTFDDSWKRHMMTCYQAAKEMCRLQEAILQQFGLIGLLCMQRGVSFSIYSILTCTMLHLVAVTSPDSDISHGAAEYFARHMRILEQCTSSWPIKEIQAQIESLRQAFSADVSKPFELRPNFPGSPPRSDRSSPPFGDQTFSTRTYLPTPTEELPLSYAPLTPPQSDAMTTAAENYRSPDPLPVTSTGPESYGSASSNMQSVMPQTYWNPSRIFDQWNTAFGMPQATSATQPPATASNPVNTSSELNSQAQHGSSNYPTYSQSMTTGPGYPPTLNQAPLQQSWAPPSQPYITPSMWQHAVASTYGEGLKRRWNENSANPMGRDLKRVR